MYIKKVFVYFSIFLTHSYSLHTATLGFSVCYSWNQFLNMLTLFHCSYGFFLELWRAEEYLMSCVVRCNILFIVIPLVTQTVLYFWVPWKHFIWHGFFGSLSYEEGTLEPKCQLQVLLHLCMFLLPIKMPCVEHNYLQFWVHNSVCVFQVIVLLLLFWSCFNQQQAAVFCGKVLINPQQSTWATPIGTHKVGN